MSVRVGFVGAGKMAQALARGMINTGTVSQSGVSASCPPQDKVFLNEMKAYGVHTTHDNHEVVSRSDVVVLAVKPQVLSVIAKDIGAAVDKSKLLVSIAMGVRMDTLQKLFPSAPRLARVMPNQPVMVGTGASTYVLSQGCEDGDGSTVRTLMEAVGLAEPISEHLMDAATALAASSPAYIFALIEAMTDIGVKHGFSAEQARVLAAQSVRGSAAMVLQTNKHPAQLRSDVQSPLGCTIYGTHKLEQSGFRAAIMDAIDAAAQRASDVSKQTASS